MEMEPVDANEKRTEEIKFEDVDFSSPTLLDEPSYRRRRSPIIVELSDHEITTVDLQKMMEAGMNIAKLKMSFSTKDNRVRLLGKVDKAAAACCDKYGVADWPVATCVTLKTCIVKTGLLENEGDRVEIAERAEVILTKNIASFDKCNDRIIFVDNSHLAKDVKVGMEITIGQDELIMLCTGLIDDHSIKCVVTKGGVLTNMCNVCVRGLIHSRPYLTKKDFQILKFCLQYQVDMIIINYVRHPDTIRRAKQYMDSKVKRPIILCGICTQQGLDCIDDILKECDGLVFQRDFLPYELDKSKQYRMNQILKWVGAKCQQAGKPFFLSGGVFQTALSNGRFRGSEVSDITNALLDGVTGFVFNECFDVDMLIDTIYAINDICCSVEPLAFNKTDFWRLTNELEMPMNAAEATVMSCAMVANQTKARVIVLPTVTGRTAKALLWMRPSCILITVSTNIRVTRLLYTYRSVVPLMYKSTDPPNKKWYKNVAARIEFATEYAVSRGWMVYGDTFVTLQRGGEGSSFCDTVRIFKVAISKKALVECPDGTDLGSEKRESVASVEFKY